MVDGGELFGNNGAGFLLPLKEPLLHLVLRSQVFGLQLGQGPHHTRDEGCSSPQFRP